MPASPRTELLSMIDEAFDGRAWHGPTLRRAVAGVTPAQAAWRPAPGRHSIREVVLHAAYWKHEVRRRITGGPRKQLLRPKEEFQGTVWGLAFHPAGFLVGAGAGSGGLLWFWKPDKPESFFTFKLPNNARDLALHPDGTRLAVACFDNAARLYTMAPKPAA